MKLLKEYVINMFIRYHHVLEVGIPITIMFITGILTLS